MIKVKVIGIERKTGENTRGKYDFYLLHCTTKESKSIIEGERAISAFLPDHDVPYVKIGDVVDISIRWTQNGNASVAYYPHD